MKLNKRALTLGVAATMVGGMVSLASVSPAGAAQIADNCGIYLQGNIDPAGALIPAGALPAPPTVNDPGQRTYIVRGHEAKGGDKIINDLNNSATGAVRFSLGVTLGGLNGTIDTGSNAPTLGSGPGDGGSTQIKVAWKNDKNVAGKALHPSVQVAEKEKLPIAAKANIAKGVVTGVSGVDTVGPALGNVTRGAAPSTNSSWGLRTPKAATSGTYILRQEFPSIAPPPLTDAVFETTLDWNDSASDIQTALNATYALLGGPWSVSGTNFAAGTQDGVYTVTAGGAFSLQSVPDVVIKDGSVTGHLADTILDDGSVWNSLRNGGGNAGINVISDLGNAGGLGNIYSASGVMSSGDIPAFSPLPLKTTGKANFQNDTQFLVLHYPVAIVNALAPGLSGMGGTAAVLSAITGLTVGTDQCDLLGLLALFCTATPSQIPPSFAPICAAF